MFPWEFCEIPKNIFSTEHLETIASGYSLKKGANRTRARWFWCWVFKIESPVAHLYWGIKEKFYAYLSAFLLFFFLHKKRIAFKCSIDLYLSFPDHWIILIYWAATHNQEKGLLLKPGPWKPGPWKTWTLKNMGNGWIWKND